MSENNKERNFRILKEIAALKENWNNEGAKPFSEELIEKCQAVVHCLDEEMQPFITPVATGCIQLKYERNGDYLEIEVHPDRSEIMRIVTRNGERKESYMTIHQDKNNGYMILEIVRIIEFFFHRLTNMVRHSLCKELRYKDADPNQYIEVYFRIETGYKWGEGRSEEAADVFVKETRQIFKDIGFCIQQGRRASSCDVAYRGNEYLYLHPMNFSGYILRESIPMISEAILKAKSFTLRTIDTYDTIRCYTPEEFEDELKRHEQELRQKYMTIFKTKRRNLFVPEGAMFSVKSGIAYDHYNKDLEYIEILFLRNLFSKLIAEGKLVGSKIKNGIGYRSVA